MYNPNRKIFGFGGDDIPAAEQPKRNFMRKPVKFQTAETENQTDEHTTTKWSIICGFDSRGFYKLLVPPNTSLHNIERPNGYPNYSNDVPTQKTSHYSYRGI